MNLWAANDLIPWLAKAALTNNVIHFRYFEFFKVNNFIIVINFVISITVILNNVIPGDLNNNVIDNVIHFVTYKSNLH